MTFEAIFHLKKEMPLLNVRIYRNSYQNRFVNEYDKKLKCRSVRVTRSQSVTVSFFEM